MNQKDELWKNISIGVNATIKTIQQRDGALSPQAKKDIETRLRPQLLDGFALMFQEVGITRDEAIKGITDLVAKALA